MAIAAGSSASFSRLNRRGRSTSNLALRAGTAAIGVPLVLGVNYVGGYVLAAFVGVAAAVGAWECARLLTSAGVRGLYALTVPAAVATAVLPVRLAHPQAAWIGIIVLVLVLVGGYYLLPHVYPSARPGWFLNVMPPVYVGLLLGHLHLLRTIHRGQWWVFVVLLMTWAYDTGAYLAGSYFGRHPFMKYVSARKTLEGVVGGLVASTLAGFAAIPALGLEPWQAPILGFLMGIATQLGDLIESMLKRQAGAKDSGTLLPGHGGLLDRIDGLLLSGALGYYAAVAMGYAT
jgi:phosphatidate cytidylyltransferase